VLPNLPYSFRAESRRVQSGYFSFWKAPALCDLVIVLAMGLCFIDLLLVGIGDRGGEIGRRILGIKILFNEQN